MKNLKLITLGLTLAGVALTMAQPADLVVARPPAPPPVEAGLIGREVATALAEQRAQLAVATEHLAEAKAQADVQRKMVLAQAGGGGAFGLAGAGSSRSPRALVIPKDASDAKNLGEVEEDLGVMAHILDKAVSAGNKATRAMGISVFVNMGSTAPRNFYIEGHGAIFLLNVNYPLVPPPAKAEPDEAKAPVNNEWEEARRELARPGKLETGGDPFGMFEERYGADATWNGKPISAEYDAEQVEDLKKELIAVLKNAANIRRLKSDETVTVVVTGAEAGVMTKTFQSAGGKPSGAREARTVVARVSTGERTRVGEAAKLILRTRKADAEAFQNGKLDFDAFRKKVTVLVF